MAAAEAWARQEKVRKFEEFVDQRLKPDLANAIAQRDKVFEQQKTFLDLKRNIENLERNGVTSMRSMVNLGSEVYMQAEVPDTRHIFVDIGLGFHVEFTWQEALQFISVREARLTRQEWVFSICSASPAIGGSTSPASGASTLFGDQQQVPPPSPGARYFEDELLGRCCSSISARNWSLGRGVLDTSEIKPHNFMESFVPFGGFMCDTYEANSLTANSCPQALRCQQCNDRYEQEVTIIRGSGITAEAHQEGLPSMLQNGSMMGPNNGFDALKVRDDQMVLSTKILNLKKKWNEYCLRIHQGCNRINRDPCQLFPHQIDVRVDRERCANPNQSSQSVALQREVIRPSAVSSPHTNTTAKSISAPSISTQMNADLVLNLQVRKSKSDEPLQDRAVPSQHSNSSNCDNPEDHASPSSAAPVATDLVLATPRGSSSKDSSNALCKHVEDAEGSIQLMPRKVDDLNLKPSHFSAQPYTYFRSSSNWDQTSPSALHSAASGGASAFGQWQRPSPLAAQSYDLSNYKLLMERLLKAVGRQEEALSAICASIVRCRSTERRRGANKKNDIWFSFYGPDSIAKRRVGVALAELMHDSSENLIYLDLSLHDWGNPNFRGKHATDCISEELRRKRRSVIFLDNVDKADCLVQESLIHAMETGRYKDLHGGRVADLNDSIVVLSTRMIQGCQDASLGMEEGNVFSEEKVVASRGNQLKIIVEPGTANISGGPGGKVVVSSRHSLRNNQASLYSSSFSKRKLQISDEQEKTAESPSTSKRLHRTSSVPFDLNLPGDEAEVQDGDDDSSSSHGNSSGDPEGSVGNLLRSVDESINFKPFDFGKLCEDILQEFSNTMSKTLGSRCRLEIDAVAMEQVVAAAAWASDSHEKRPVRTWVEQVFARSLEQLKVRCKNLSSCTLRLVACEHETPVKEDSFGSFLPSRIILDW